MSKQEGIDHSKGKLRRVIIGDGLSAAAFLESLPLDNLGEIIVIGRTAKQFGRGLAYASAPKGAEWEYAYLLNSPACDIDTDFKPWLDKNWSMIESAMDRRKPNWLAAAQGLIAKGDVSALNIPRAFFGDFLVERVQKKIAEYRAQGIVVQFIEDEATLIDEVQDGIEVRTVKGERITADLVDVAPGGQQDQRMQGDEGPFSAPTLFGNEERIIEHIKSGADIWCVGMNATMLDALRLCQSAIPDSDIKFTACSPRGILPEPLIPNSTVPYTPDLTEGYSTAASFLDDVKNAIERANANGIGMREIRAGFRGFFIDHGLAKFVPDQNEARIVPRTLRHWLRGGTRDTILDFHRLQQSGITNIAKGAVREIEVRNNKALIVTEDKSGEIIRHEAGFVINCSGAGSSFNFDPITNVMIGKGWIDICDLSGGIAVGQGCQTKIAGVRFLSPATTVIGDDVMPMPLYDAHLLRTWAARANMSV